MALFLKCLLGALAVLLIALLAHSKNFYMAGLVPLFPRVLFQYVMTTNVLRSV